MPPSIASAPSRRRAPRSTARRWGRGCPPCSIRARRRSRGNRAASSPPQGGHPPRALPRMSSTPRLLLLLPRIGSESNRMAGPLIASSVGTTVGLPCNRSVAPATPSSTAVRRAPKAMELCRGCGRRALVAVSARASSFAGVAISHTSELRRRAPLEEEEARGLVGEMREREWRWKGRRWGK
jgi:hypothetical protein